MTDMTDWDNDILSEDGSDDDIIELTDIVEGNSDHTTKEDVIELTDVVEKGSTDFNLDIGKEESDEDEDFELEVDGQLEAALESIIEKKFADKIDALLFEVMENVIEKEIAKIKERLQKEFDQ